MSVEDPGAMLRELDRRGMSPVTYAAIMSALASDSLLPLLSLLEPPQGEASKTDAILEALERVLDSQRQILAEQAQIKSDLAAIKSRLPASR